MRPNYAFKFYASASLSWVRRRAAWHETPCATLLGIWAVCNDANHPDQTRCIILNSFSLICIQPKQPLTDSRCCTGDSFAVPTTQVRIMKIYVRCEMILKINSLFFKCSAPTFSCMVMSPVIAAPLLITRLYEKGRGELQQKAAYSVNKTDRAQSCTEVNDRSKNVNMWSNLSTLFQTG